MEHNTHTGPTHKSHFTAIYNLLDPRRYYEGLAPADYRMPDVVAGFLRAAGTAIAQARRPREGLKVLDFACGYGANGALLRHELCMADLYAYYAGHTWSQRDGDVHWAADRAFFSAHRLACSSFEVAGIDIAANALAYDVGVGLIDHAFTDNLVSDRAGSALKDFLAEVDIVIESGALGPGLSNAFANVLADADESRRPWFLYSPRPDVDWVALDGLWSRVGYCAQACNQMPVPYRRALSAAEATEMMRDCVALGKSPERVFVDGYLAVDLMIALPLEIVEPTHNVFAEIFAELPLMYP